MEIGGVILGAGTVMDLAVGSYLNGNRPVRFTVETIIETRQEWGVEWVILSGMQQPTATSSWRDRQIQVRVSALKASLVLA